MRFEPRDLYVVTTTFTWRDVAGNVYSDSFTRETTKSYIERVKTDQRMRILRTKRDPRIIAVTVRQA